MGIGFDKLKQSLGGKPRRVTTTESKRRDIKYYFSGKQLKITGIQALIVFILTIILLGLVTQYFRVFIRKQRNIYIFSVFKYAFSNPLLFLLFFVGLNIVGVMLRDMLKKEFTKDDRNFEVSEKGTYGTAKVMTENMFDKTFNLNSITETTSNIIGHKINDYDKLVSLKPLRGINNHKLIVGASGSRKSRSQAVPDIFQSIRRGESCVVTDPKGELYSKTAPVAQKHGYTVKVLNLKPEEMENSDGCHFLGVVGNNTLMAQTVANSIMLNTREEGSKKDYWENGENSLLTFFILFTSMNENLRPEERTLGTMYNMLLENNVSKITAMAMSLPRNHPAYRSFMVFNDGTDAAKASVRQGLLMRLQVLQDETVQRICSENEIDFLELGKSKCIYYVIMSDQEETMDFIAALFFTLLFIRLVAFADSLPNQMLPVIVNFILDEFPSIGTIPAFSKKESTVRSRGINLTIICQDIGQLMDKYPGNVWRTIMSNCSTHILLATNDQQTAEVFSNRSGDMTVVVDTKRVSEGRFDPLKIHNFYMQNIGLGRRKVYLTDEVMKLDEEEALVVIQGRDVTKVIKYDLSEHPFAAEMEDGYLPCNHIPEWRRRDMELAYGEIYTENTDIYSASEPTVPLKTVRIGATQQVSSPTNSIKYKYMEQSEEGPDTPTSTQEDELARINAQMARQQKNTQKSLQVTALLQKYGK